MKPVSARRYPLSLSPVRGSLEPALAENAVLSLGAEARASRSLLEEGFVAPDVLAGMTLFLLAGQPRRTAPATGQNASAKGRGIAGSVWVREHFTVHRPARVGEAIEVTGAVERAYSKRGRRYTVTVSETRSENGTLLASNCTTGLARFRRDGLQADSSEGLGEQAVRRPTSDAAAASTNPAVDFLRTLKVGDEIRGSVTPVLLEQMQRRDGGTGRNPIHTDEEAARQAGLAQPIAGGAHVFGYLQEALMRALGSNSLLHGACFDLYWVSQVRPGDSVTPRASVSVTAPDRVEFDLRVECDERAAMLGSVALPLPIA